MAQRAPITLADRETTPVNHIFTPNGGDTHTANFRRAGASLIEDERLSVSLREQPDRTKTRQVIAYPFVVTEVVNGVSQTRVLYTDYATVEFQFDKRSTTQRRKNLVGMTEKSLAPSQTILSSVFVDNERIW